MKMLCMTLAATVALTATCLAKDKSSSSSSSSSSSTASSSSSSSSGSKLNLNPSGGSNYNSGLYKPQPSPNPNTGSLGGIQYRKQTTDTGANVNKQYQVDVNKKSNTFVYGESNTNYPGNRYPGQQTYNPNNPTQAPRTNYGAGVGVRF